MLEIPEVSDLTALREIHRRESVFDTRLTAAARRQWLSGSVHCHLLLQQFIKLCYKSRYKSCYKSYYKSVRIVRIVHSHIFFTETIWL